MPDLERQRQRQDDPEPGAAARLGVPFVELDALVRRTARRMVTGEEVWNGNRESLGAAVWGRDSLFGYALRIHFTRRRAWPAALAPYPVVRLRTDDQVSGWLHGLV